MEAMITTIVLLLTVPVDISNQGRMECYIKIVSNVYIWFSVHIRVFS